MVLYSPLIYAVRTLPHATVLFLLIMRLRLRLLKLVSNFETETLLYWSQKLRLILRLLSLVSNVETETETIISLKN